MIYEFFTDKTTGTLTNYLSDFSNISLKMIEYKILDNQTLSGFQEYDVKRFTFGYEGDSFHFYITKNDRVILKPTLKSRIFSKISKNFKQYDIETTKTIHDYLLSFVRDQKLNQIIK
jgi:hypothetical protein